jgi:pyruvate/2-oxoglutarate/acetoin dehydrogenase E1 component
MPNFSYAQAIHQALYDALQSDENVILIGEGVPDPKAIFNTTAGLQQTFGSHRVFDMPLSENAMTGICLGAATQGMRPVLVHQRIDFSLLSLDQVMNHAAKWHYLFNGQVIAPMVIRLIIGRGWGQGPQHSQALHGLFAAIPGLKVVLPTFAQDAYSMMRAAISDNNPVVFIEHRWLHGVQGQLEAQTTADDLSCARVVRQGAHITLAAWSLMVIEALNAAQALAQFGIELCVVDMRVAHRFDTQPVIESLQETGRLIAADLGHTHAALGQALIGDICQANFDLLQQAPVLIANPNYPVSTSHYQVEDYYAGAKEIVAQALVMLNKTALQALVVEKLVMSSRHDVPNSQFTGPF